jgi:hypothetical protein
VIRIENEISSIPADYAQRHIQAEQSRDWTWCFRLTWQTK